MSTYCVPRALYLAGYVTSVNRLCRGTEALGGLIWGISLEKPLCATDVSLEKGSGAGRGEDFKRQVHDQHYLLNNFRVHGPGVLMSFVCVSRDVVGSETRIPI